MRFNLPRAATVVTATATALISVAAPATAAPTALQKFYADSGDRCAYGRTEGVLNWNPITPTQQPVVAVDGTLTDDPSAVSPRACADDKMYSTATYVAYAGSTVVDYAQARADNGTVRVQDLLGEGSSIAARIDRVVIQVCRFPSSPVGISYCGPAQTYARSSIGPA